LPDAKTNTDWLQPPAENQGLQRPPIATEDAGGLAAQAATLP
jgi:hypothetical protein